MRRSIRVVLLGGFLLGGCAAQAPSSTGDAAGADEMAVAPKIAAGSAEASVAGIQGMTRAEVTACAASITSIDQAQSTLNQLGASLEAKNVEIGGEEKALERERPKVDVRSAAKVADFNTRIASHRKDVRAFNERVTQYNAQVSQTRLQQSTYNVQCANRPYRVADLKDLPDEQRKAMEAGARPFDQPVIYPDAAKTDPSSTDIIIGDSPADTPDK